MLFARTVSLLLATAAAAGAGVPKAARGRAASFPPLLDATLEDLREGLDNGLFTSTDLVKAYLARIQEVNPTLKAVLELNPDALAIAAEADAARRRGPAVHKPLLGIPILVKDIIGTDDQMNTTAGSYALLGSKVAEDSTVVKKLRRAGAVILGKTNLSEWSYTRGFNIPAGWSAYGGQTLGAYFPGQDPSGSSSGSAVATSIGLAWAALGVETVGSIISPSQINNIVGLRPTVGLTSRHMVVPSSSVQDTVGPMARTVKDAAYLLAAIAGGDAKDNATWAIPFDEMPDYVAACSLDGLRGKHIGVARDLIDADFDPLSGPAIAAFDGALDVLREAGAIVVDNVATPGLSVLTSEATVYSYLMVLGVDMQAAMPQYLSRLRRNPSKVRSISDIRNFTQHHPEERYPEFDTGYWDMISTLGFGNASAKYRDTRGALRDLAGELGLTGGLANFTLDALVAPSEFSTLLSGILGTPLVTVPMGATAPGTAPVKSELGDVMATGPNRPFGISFLGAKWSEAALLGMAYAYEQRTRVRQRVRPHVQPATGLEDVVGAVAAGAGAGAVAGLRGHGGGV